MASPVLREALRREGPQAPVESDLHEGRPDRKAEPPARVRCPLCGWRHDGKPHWGCDACFAVFDTFLTRATCPNCGKTWRETQCPSCHRLSPHLDWYVRDNPPS